MRVDEPEVSSEVWRAILLGTYWQFRAGRRLLKHLPHEPRCKLCAAPFQGPGAPFMRVIGKGPWPKNPTYCGSCFKTLANNHGGAEIPCSLLFADVRGSTQMAESMRPTDFRILMDRFFRTASTVLPRRRGPRGSRDRGRSHSPGDNQACASTVAADRCRDPYRGRLRRFNRGGCQRRSDGDG
jgi:hypothetical protein